MALVDDNNFFYHKAAPGFTRGGVPGHIMDTQYNQKLWKECIRIENKKLCETANNSLKVIEAKARGTFSHSPFRSKLNPHMPDSTHQDQFCDPREQCRRRRDQGSKMTVDGNVVFGPKGTRTHHGFFMTKPATPSKSPKEKTKPDYDPNDSWDAFLACKERIAKEKRPRIQRMGSGFGTGLPLVPVNIGSTWHNLDRGKSVPPDMYNTRDYHEDHIYKKTRWTKTYDHELNNKSPNIMIAVHHSREGCDRKGKLPPQTRRGKKRSVSRTHTISAPAIVRDEDLPEGDFWRKCTTYPRPFGLQ